MGANSAATVEDVGLWGYRTRRDVRLEGNRGGYREETWVVVSHSPVISWLSGPVPVLALVLVLYLYPVAILCTLLSTPPLYINFCTYLNTGIVHYFHLSAPLSHLDTLCPSLPLISTHLSSSLPYSRLLSSSLCSIFARRSGLMTQQRFPVRAATSWTWRYFSPVFVNFKETFFL